ncbi:MAG TPA: hypothetical protein VGL65_06335 [Gemmatimonadales bacterium]|jgi:hypothetical protein
MRNAWMVMAAATLLAAPLAGQKPASPAPRARPRAAAPGTSADSAKRFAGIRQRYQKELDTERGALQRTRDRMREELTAAGWRGRHRQAPGMFRGRLARFRARRGPMTMRGPMMRRGMFGGNAMGPRGRMGGPPDFGNGPMMRPGMAFGGRGQAPMMMRRGMAPGGRGQTPMMRRGQPGDSGMAMRGRAMRRPGADSTAVRRRAPRDTSAAPMLDR